MKPWLWILIAAGVFWGSYAAYSGGIAFAPQEPIADSEVFDYCYSTDDNFVICKLKEK